MDATSIDTEPAPRCEIDRGRGHTTKLEGIGQRLADALAEKNFPALHAVLSDEIRFRLLVPKGPQEEAGAAATVGRFVGWFADADPARLESSAVEAVADRVAVSYRFRLFKPDGWRLLEQHLMADVDQDSRVRAIDLLCSGFRPLSEEAAATIHRLDAADLGCADGLADQFRREIAAIPVGDVLEVSVRDPAAKQDLPALARMMGHPVRSMETTDQGHLLISVERGR